jgi:hypothetical protein
MTDDLVQRLREVGRDGTWKSRRNPTAAHPMCIKAADRIEALEAENERLREALAHIAFSGADGPYGEFGEALNEHQMRRVAKAALQEKSK